MICKLCNRDKKLVKAHLIPAWAFRYMYPSFSIKREPLILVGPKKHKRSPIGIYDPEILCRECDIFLGKFDNYGKKIILISPIEKYKNSNDANIIRNIEILKISIFFLSVLWRCSVSGREEVKGIDLGKYEQEIHSIIFKLLNGDNDVEKKIDEFSIILARFNEGRYPELADKTLHMPLRHRIEGVNFNVLYFPRGFKVYIKTDRRSFPDSLRTFFIPATKEIVIPKLKNYEETGEFQTLVKGFTRKIGVDPKSAPKR